MFHGKDGYNIIIGSFKGSKKNRKKYLKKGNLLKALPRKLTPEFSVMLYTSWLILCLLLLRFCALLLNLALVTRLVLPVRR